MENPFPGVLVELIVVLVILAILAAMMVPALLGYIDEARNKQYVLEARSVYMAAQAVADEAYGSGKLKLTKDDLSGTAATARIKTLSDVDLPEGWLVKCFVGDGTSDIKNGFKIESMHIALKADGGKCAHAVLGNGAWTVGISDSATELPSGVTEATGTIELEASTP